MSNRRKWCPPSHRALSLTKQQQDLVNRAIKENYYRGIEAGKAQAVKTCYAAMCLAARDTYKFGKKRVLRLLRAMDKHVCETLASDEAIDEVFERLGIRITFSSPFENIEEVEENHV